MRSQMSQVASISGGHGVVSQLSIQLKRTNNDGFQIMRSMRELIRSNISF